MTLTASISDTFVIPLVQSSVPLSVLASVTRVSNGRKLHVSKCRHAE